ncbi:MAG TPA: NAD(P)-dependent oxidoreductase [Acidobacteriaceae bacterium]|nr:NAD(P)-dependent oxidoreductase [Acidobacteriaceae bacterium]
MRVGFLGLGKMGRPMAGSLLAQGHRLVVWNRTPSAAAFLKNQGAEVAATPADAVRGAEIVFTMLADDAATEEIVFGPPPGGPEARTLDPSPGLLQSMEAGAIHVASSTISVRLSHRIAQAHDQHGQHFVAAPVFGRPAIAEQGRLWMVVAGAREAQEKVLPLLRGISRGLTVVSEKPWLAHALKLGGNFMISSMIQALCESFVFAEAEGIEPGLFLQTVNDALFQSPFYTLYGNTILHPPEQPGATIAMGSKDTALFLEAAGEIPIELPLADFLAQQIKLAEQAGMQDEEWTVSRYRIARQIARGRASGGSR